MGGKQGDKTIGRGFRACQQVEVCQAGAFRIFQEIPDSFGNYHINNTLVAFLKIHMKW